LTIPTATIAACGAACCTGLVVISNRVRAAEAKRLPATVFTMTTMNKALRLFLFSDHLPHQPQDLEERLLEAAGQSPSVAWIPAGSSLEKLEMFFAARRDAYARLGVVDFEMFTLHEGFNADRVPWLFSRRIIHLSGGDPYLFLRNLRKTGMLDALLVWAMQGGILVGDSAGAMLMTPSLGIAHFDGKPVPEDMADSSALGLVDFEVNPHFGKYGGSADDLRAYSKQHHRTVYGLVDGGALAVLNGQIETQGQIICFRDGEESILS